MAMRGRNAMGGRNPGRSKSIEDALRQVLAGGGRGSSPRPKLRPQARPNATSPRPKLRPETIGGMEGGSTRGVSPIDNYSKEDLMRLLGSVASGGAGAAGLGGHPRDVGPRRTEGGKSRINLQVSAAIPRR